MESVALNEGYRLHPLVSLEQALEPVLSIIDQLKILIEEAKTYSQFPLEHGLTLDESAAIRLYTMQSKENSLYKLLNQTLRDADPIQIRPWHGYLKILDEAFRKLPIERKRLWRAIKDEIAYKKGEEIVWKSISSCSTSLEAAEELLDPDNDSVFFMIKAAHAKNLAGYSIFAGEAEYILPMNTRLNVVGIGSMSGKRRTIEMAEIDDSVLNKSNGKLAYMERSQSISRQTVGTFILDDGFDGCEFISNWVNPIPEKQTRKYVDSLIEGFFAEAKMYSNERRAEIDAKGFAEELRQTQDKDLNIIREKCVQLYIRDTFLHQITSDGCNPFRRKTFHRKIFFPSLSLLLRISKREKVFEKMFFGEEDSYQFIIRPGTKFTVVKVGEEADTKKYLIHIIVSKSYLEKREDSCTIL